MLDKEICKICYKINGWDKYQYDDEIRLYKSHENKYGWICVMQHVKEYVDEEGQIPEECPYKLEHLMKEQKHTKKKFIYILVDRLKGIIDDYRLKHNRN